MKKIADFLIFKKISYHIKASDGNRTRDLFTTNEVRYHLCHASI